jgi:hypothetical protein
LSVPLLLAAQFVESRALGTEAAICRYRWPINFALFAVSSVTFSFTLSDRVGARRLKKSRKPDPERMPP